MSFNIELLEQSFERVKPHATSFSSSFYNNLLTDYPQLRPLFTNTKMEEQEKKLIMSLMLVIQNLRNLPYLTTMLKDLGERHVRYGAMREHYPMMGAALLKTFESYLGPDWTPEVKQAWTDAYEAIVNLMLSGAKYPESTSKLENALQQSAKPDVMDFAPTQVTANVSSLNYSDQISKLEYVSKQSAKPAVTGAPTPATATASSLNLKLLLMIIFVVAGLLGVGFLYYHSSSKQNNSSFERSTSESVRSGYSNGDMRKLDQTSVPLLYPPHNIVC